MNSGHCLLRRLPPSAATGVAPASLITDPGADVEEVDAVRQEVVEVDDQPRRHCCADDQAKNGRTCRQGRPTP